MNVDISKKAAAYSHQQFQKDGCPFNMFRIKFFISIDMEFQNSRWSLFLKH